MLLSDRFLGFFMIPGQGSWNYNFMVRRTFFEILSDAKLNFPIEIRYLGSSP